MSATKARDALGTCAALLAGIALTGCAVGPDFRRPEPPAVRGYTEQALPAQTASAPGPGGQAQHFLENGAVASHWWTQFHSPELDALIERALRDNADVQAAQAALRQANELVAVQRGSLFPELQASYAAEREKNPVATLAPTLSSGAEVFTLHTAQLSVSYVLDVFGANRRALESQQALADAQRFQLQATYLTLIANVVTSAVQIAGLRAQLGATRAMLASERDALEILQHQSELGSIAPSDVLAQQALVAQTEASLPALEKQLTQQQDQIAVLTGRFPGQEPAPRFELGSLSLPLELPVSVPARLVRQRPDVLAAEAQLHAASAQLGVAIAELLPQVSLTGNLGGTATQLQRLFAAGNSFWSAGASLTQTLFEGGALWHKSRAARAALDQAGAQYRGTVLMACQQVADSLRAVELDAQSLAASARAERSAAEALNAARRNVEIGAASYLTLLSAQQNYQQALASLAQAQTSRYADTAGLFQALGGGPLDAGALTGGALDGGTPGGGTRAGRALEVR